MGINRKPGGQLDWYLSRAPEAIAGGSIDIQVGGDASGPKLWLDRQTFSEEELLAVHTALATTNDQKATWFDTYGRHVKDRHRRMLRSLARQIRSRPGHERAISSTDFQECFFREYPDPCSDRSLRTWTDEAHDWGYLSKWTSGTEGKGTRQEACRAGKPAGSLG